MGNILTCFQLSQKSQPESANNSQKHITTQSQTPAAVQGLQNEHLASVPPPALGTGTAAAEGLPDESRDLSRNVGLGAPVPLPVSTSITTTDKGKEGEDKMATDEEYMSFLDKANQDPNEGVAKGESNGGGKIELKATDKGASVPAVLKEIEAYYVSDADEPFEPVCLKCGKGLPDEVAFAKLVNHPSPKEAGVEIMDIGQWDSQGQYKDVVEKVREASKGSDVRVYRIGKGGSRVEYWVIGVEGGRLVGVKALAIET